MSFAIIWYVTLQTSSGKWIMLFTICSLLPQVLISLWAGVWTDRHNRKHLIMLADGFIALATLGLVIAFWAGVPEYGTTFSDFVYSLNRRRDSDALRHCPLSTDCTAGKS